MDGAAAVMATLCGCGSSDDALLQVDPGLPPPAGGGSTAKPGGATSSGGGSSTGAGGGSGSGSSSGASSSGGGEPVAPVDFEVLAQATFDNAYVTANATHAYLSMPDGAIGRCELTGCADAPAVGRQD